MPKISEERRRERRNQYLDAARRCISRSGVHGTRMEDVTSEAGLSSGSMYLYFATKDELVRAAIDSSLRELEALVAATVKQVAPAGPARFLEALLSRLEQFGGSVDEVDLFRLGVQGWAYSQTDAEAARLISESHSRLHGSFAAAAEVWTDNPAGISPIADALLTQLTGFALRRGVIGSGSAQDQFASTTALALALTNR
ncbi:MAG: TetR/AcrR family transcriptional regulator [Micropruina sp.]